jgi:GAF domain-containing protein
VVDLPQTGLDAGREALRRFLVGDDDQATLLQAISLLAVATVPGANGASITLLLRDQPTTVTATTPVAEALDQVQYDEGDGPCLSAFRHHGLEHLVVGDSRWPRFEREAQEHGVRAVMAAPLVDEHEAAGSLNLYTVHGFPRESEEVARLFADQLALAAAKATIHMNQAELAGELQRAMESRAVIEQAKGILMANEHCDPERAFDILRQASQHQNRKLRDVAEELVDRYKA